jgi:hypothetical protein
MKTEIAKMNELAGSQSLYRIRAMKITAINASSCNISIT